VSFVFCFVFFSAGVRRRNARLLTTNHHHSSKQRQKKPTTNSACCVYALSTNPSAQRRLCAEIDAFFGEHGQDAPLTPEAIAAHFPYAEGAVKEALRYYTPVTNIPREVTALPESPDPHAWRSDLIVGAAKASSPHGGVSSPPPPLHPGIVVVAANYVYQRSSEFWPRAHEFLPERWVPEDRGGAASVLGASTPWAWTPFGGGPRRCVGLKFALLEAAIVIVRLFQSYSFEPAPGQKVPLPMKQTVTHHPDGGVHVVVKRREEAKQRQR
jgi:cytochrome P450